MTWKEFEEKYHFRDADKCCMNCRHGAEEYYGDCRCLHPLVADNEEFCGNATHNVCDLWDKREKGGSR